MVRSLIRLVEASNEYDVRLQKTDLLDRLEEYYLKNLLNIFKEKIHMLNWIMRFGPP